MTAQGGDWPEDFVPPAVVTRKPRPSERFPLLRPVAVQAHRLRRRWVWLRADVEWATPGQT